MYYYLCILVGTVMAKTRPNTAQGQFKWILIQPANNHHKENDPQEAV